MKLRSLHITVSLLLVLGTGCDPYADLPQQSDLDSWELFNTSKGLVSDSITCIIADQNGDIWAGTPDKGLMHFDGNSWTSYTTAHGLPDIAVTALLDYGGQIWAGTFQGLSLMQNGAFTEYMLLEDLYITDLAYDYNSDIWVGTYQAGIIHLKGGSDFDQYFKDEPGRNRVNSIDVWYDNSVWAGTNAGLYNITGNGKYDFYTSETGLISDTVTAVYSDGYDFVWIGDYYSDRILRVDYEVREMSLFNGSTLVAVNSIIEDFRGNVWFATIGSGVSMYDGVTMHAYGVSDGLPSIHIVDMAVDPDGSIWFASLADGIVKYTPGGF